MSSSASDSITRSKWLDRVLFAAVALVLGIGVLRDNHHPTRNDLLVFLASATFWWLALSSVAVQLGIL